MGSASLLVFCVMSSVAANSRRSSSLTTKGNANPSLASVMRRFRAQVDPETARLRHLLADLCRVLGAQATGAPVTPGRTSALSELVTRRLQDPDLPSLSPRVRQTLDRLLHGDSEKQVARRLNVSQHTVHVYVKTLYRKLNVCSRGELLSKFVGRRG
jgi:DNA-binding NarL/FixJ family response regulator